MTPHSQINKIKLTLSCCLAVFVASASAGQPKHVAVAPKDMDKQQLVAAELTGVFSHSTMLPIDFSKAQTIRAADGSESLQLTQTIYLDNPENSPILFLGPQAESWQVTIANPNGIELLNEQSGNASRLPLQSFNIGQQSFTGKQFSSSTISSGEYQISLTRPATQALQRASKTNGDGFLMFKGDPSFKLYSHYNQQMTLQNTPLQLVAYAIEDKSRSADRHSMLHQPALASSITHASVTITSPTNQQKTIMLNDDGIAGDKVAGDGHFSASLPTNQIGVYTTQLQVQGIRPDGAPYTRTVTELYPIEAKQYSIQSKPAKLKLQSGYRASIAVPVKHQSNAEPVYMSGELWGTRADGERVAAAWLGGVVSASGAESDRQLQLSFDTRWLTRQQLQAPFALKSVRLQTLDTNVPIAQRDRLLIDAQPNLVAQIYQQVASKALNASTTLTSDTIDQQMLMGPAPESLQHNLNNANVRAASNPKLMLVHGYCSGDAWQSSQFSNAIEFQDFKKNRSHEEFAQLILDFGAPYSSYGIVAHSQGGAAALHLYSRYWSGLDYATGGRIIQSVGTPYQGTALAGNLAALGEVFGAGCGKNTDLTYSGASNWLATIPSWARSQVDYYTTSFNTKWWRYDYCHLATDLFLNDPEDGTTEKWSGQLSGAVNKGHKKGWCHTTGMRDPAQTTDSSRNSSMNSRAAR